jgi:hypothetical protein
MERTSDMRADDYWLELAKTVDAVPIPGFFNYFVTESGDVFHVRRHETSQLHNIKSN